MGRRRRLVTEHSDNYACAMKTPTMEEDKEAVHCEKLEEYL